MSIARFCKRLLPVFLLAAAGFSSCLEEEMQGRVVPIGDKESYTVSDTAILYVMTGDTARVQVQFNLDADTVTGADQRRAGVRGGRIRQHGEHETDAEPERRSDHQDPARNDREHHFPW